MTPTLIFDFDSTFIKDETLDEIAKYKSRSSKVLNNLAREITQITDLAMNGTLEFSEALKKRIAMLDLNKNDISNIIELLKTRISPSFIKHQNNIKSRSSHIYIISGGFKEIIYEVVKNFGIHKDQILANDFIFDNDQIIGVNSNNPLSSKDGKVNALKALNLPEPIYIIGDGYTDFEMKHVHGVKAFICYTENINRPSVSKVADYVAQNLDETFTYIESNG